MILLIAIVVGIIVCISTAMSLFGEFADYMMGAFVGFIAFLAVVSFGTMLANIDSRTTHYVTKELSAIHDSVNQSGLFFIGSGVVDGEPTYTYYVKDGDAQVFESTAASGVKVFQGGGKPWLKQEDGCTLNHLAWLSACVGADQVVEIHVPAGTIKENYVLDAQ